MLDGLYQWCEPKATWAIFTLLFIAFLIFAQLFEQRHKALGYENQMLDGRGWYSPPDVKSLFEAIETRDTDYLKVFKTKGLNLYAVTELTLDLVFPFIYCFLIIIPIIRLYSPGNAKYLILLPIIAALADLFENALIAYLAFTFDKDVSSIAYVAAVFTLIKTALLLICVIIVLPVGAIMSIYK